MRFLENHDQPRAAFLIPDERSLRNWTAFMLFNKGPALIYAGQERGAAHQPGLFDKDTVRFDGSVDLRGLITKLAEIKKDEVFTDSSYSVMAHGESHLIASHISGGRRALGVFAVNGGCACISVDFEDGIYTNLIDGSAVEVACGAVCSLGEPIIIIKP